ncbi:MAG TPA: hypothetical protein VIQ51_06660, partial [Chryseosolibacter sp.]
MQGCIPQRYSASFYYGLQVEIKMQADKMKVKSSPEKVVGHTEGKVEYQERSDAYTHIIRGEGYKMIACTPQGSSGTEEADAR